MPLGKHCPYCRHLVFIELGQRDGICDRCEKLYIVKYHLSKIRLIKEFIPRNYEAEVMAYVTKKKRTYAGEISSYLGMSKGLVSNTLRNLEAKGAIKVTPRGKTKWISLPDQTN
jgi:predicted transcriptional regulator